LLVALSELAQRFAVFLVAGTVPLLTSQGNKFTNSSCMFNPQGELLERYDKIHLFDVAVSDNTQQYCESRYAQAGNKVSAINAEFATIGLSVCFDLRFPVLFNQLTKKGADIITLPSAFTRVTGKAHWQTLLQARAIENQVYIIAANQEGVHENGRETWGHSMIVSPWGEILACLPEKEGYISVDYQPNEVQRIRQSMPLNSPLS
jgi:predicted amidohydrolase